MLAIQHSACPSRGEGCRVPVVTREGSRIELGNFVVDVHLVGSGEVHLREDDLAVEVGFGQRLSARQKLPAECVMAIALMETIF